MNILRNDTGSVKFRELAKLLRDRIDSGDYKIGEQIPSEAALQKTFAVSRTTVRNAVGLLANDGYVKQERGKGKGTVVLDRSLRKTRLRKGLSLGAIFNMNALDSTRSDIPATMRGVVEGLNLWEANLNLFPIVSGIDQLEYAKSIVSRNVIDGLFLWYMGEHTDKIIDYLWSVNFPFVFISTDQNTTPDKQELNLLRFEERETFGAFCLQLKKQGYRDIFLLGKPGEELKRVATLFKTSEAGAGFMTQVVEVDEREGLFNATVSALEKNQKCPDSLFVVSDNSMLPYFDSAVSYLNIKIPHDISVMFYKHYASDLGIFEKKYSFWERRFGDLGQRAAGMMERLVARKEAGMDLRIGEREVINANINHRGSIAGL